MSEQEKTELSGFKPKKPFKLCFGPQNLIGKSNIQIGKPLKLPSTITPKFYCKNEAEFQCTNDDLKRQLEYLDVKGPREKYHNPVTENQRYGWYQVQLTDLDRSDRRLHFAKQTNPIVREHLMNYENIR
nr:PREDICTED: uncharacterized protein LOC107398618 [Tribolium castaneum]|eukprot:XP_015838766.1 PREDICTED: uncharacterized protein LOC107398618 [Tribolium castaneum]